MTTMLKYAMPVAVDPQTDDARMKARFCISTDSPDREDDVVDQRGLDWSAHRSNPVCLFNHDQGAGPIGKSETPDGLYTVETQDHRTYGTIYFTQSTLLGQQTYALVRDKFLRAASIAFMVQDAQARGKKQPGSRPALYIAKAQPMEYSVVSVPAQAEAVRDHADMVRGLLSQTKFEGSPLHPHIRKSLEAVAAPLKTWSNGATLEIPTMAQIQSLIVKADAFPNLDDARVWFKSQGYDLPAQPVATDDNGTRFEFFPAGDIQDGSGYDVAIEQKAVGYFAVNKNAPPPLVLAPEPIVVDATGEHPESVKTIAEAVTKAAGSDELSAPRMIAQSCKTCMKGAHDWMHEHATEKNLSLTQKAACSMHKHALAKCMKDMDDYGNDAAVGGQRTAKATEPEVVKIEPVTPAVVLPNLDFADTFAIAEQSGAQLAYLAARMRHILPRKTA